MQGDLALNGALRERYVPETRSQGRSQFADFPEPRSVKLSMTLLKEMNNALPVGPILMGPRARPTFLPPR